MKSIEKFLFESNEESGESIEKILSEFDEKLKEAYEQSNYQFEINIDGKEEIINVNLIKNFDAIKLIAPHFSDGDLSNTLVSRIQQTDEDIVGGLEKIINKLENIVEKLGVKEKWKFDRVEFRLSENQSENLNKQLIDLISKLPYFNDDANTIFKSLIYGNTNENRVSIRDKNPEYSYLRQPPKKRKKPNTKKIAYELSKDAGDSYNRASAENILESIAWLVEKYHEMIINRDHSENQKFILARKNTDNSIKKLATYMGITEKKELKDDNKFNNLAFKKLASPTGINRASVIEIKKALLKDCTNDEKPEVPNMIIVFLNDYKRILNDIIKPYSEKIAGIAKLNLDAQSKRYRLADLKSEISKSNLIAKAKKINAKYWEWIIERYEQEKTNVFDQSWFDYLDNENINPIGKTTEEVNDESIQWKDAKYLESSLTPEKYSIKRHLFPEENLVTMAYDKLLSIKETKKPKQSSKTYKEIDDVKSDGGLTSSEQEKEIKKIDRTKRKEKIKEILNKRSEELIPLFLNAAETKNVDLYNQLKIKIIHEMSKFFPVSVLEPHTKPIKRYDNKDIEYTFSDEHPINNPIFSKIVQKLLTLNDQNTKIKKNIINLIISIINETNPGVDEDIIEKMVIVSIANNNWSAFDILLNVRAMGQDNKSVIDFLKSAMLTNNRKVILWAMQIISQLPHPPEINLDKIDFKLSDYDSQYYDALRFCGIPGKQAVIKTINMTKNFDNEKISQNLKTIADTYGKELYNKIKKQNPRMSPQEIAQNVIDKSQIQTSREKTNILNPLNYDKNSKEYKKIINQIIESSEETEIQFVDAYDQLKTFREFADIPRIWKADAKLNVSAAKEKHRKELEYLMGEFGSSARESARILKGKTPGPKEVLDMMKTTLKGKLSKEEIDDLLYTYKGSIQKKHELYRDKLDDIAKDVIRKYEKMKELDKEYLKSSPTHTEIDKTETPEISQGEKLDDISGDEEKQTKKPQQVIDLEKKIKKLEAQIKDIKIDIKKGDPSTTEEQRQRERISDKQARINSIKQAIKKYYNNQSKEFKENEEKIDYLIKQHPEKAKEIKNLYNSGISYQKIIDSIF